MKILKRSIQQATITATTIIDGVEYINIIPNLNAEYNITFSLESDIKNFGFFEVYDFSGTTGMTINPELYEVTGNTISRLYEIRKHSQKSNFIDNYYHSTNINENGIVLNESNYNNYPMKIVYFLDGIKYTDYVESATGDTISKFTFLKTFPSDIDFTNKPYYKDPSKDMLSGNLNLNNNVFINRPEITALDKFYNISTVDNFFELKSYVAGNYFIIYNTI